MRKVYLYDKKTGLFSGRSFEYSGPDFDDAVTANTPQGDAWIEGDFDPATKRVDLGTGRIMEYQPPQPDEDYELSTDTGRWVKRADVARWERDRMNAFSRLELLDRKRSRALADHALRPDERTGEDLKLPHERLQEIEDEAEILRMVINQPKP
jgi:hypothetical protein